MNVKELAKQIGKGIAENRSNIVTTLVAFGVVSTVASAIKETPKVNLLIDNAVAEKGEELTKKEKAVIYAKGYWKTIALGTTTIGLLVGNRVLDAKSTTGLVGAYVAAQSKIESIQKAVKETVDEKTKKEIEDKTTKNQIDKNPPPEEPKMLPAQNNIMQTGLTLFWDDFSGHWFWSTREKIEAAVNHCNIILCHEDYVSLDTFYDELGIDTSTVSGMFGWSTSLGGWQDISISLESEWGEYNDPSRGKQYGVLKFVNEPKVYYDIYDR